MRQKAVDDFFKKWTDSFPEETKECHSDEELVNFARKIDEFHRPAHVKECRHCSEVIRLLQAKETPTQFYEFLQKANEDTARGSAPQRAWTKPSIFKTFVSFGQPRWVSVALVAALALFAFTWAINKYEPFDNGQRAAVVSLDEDKYAIAVTMMQSSIERMSDTRLSPLERATELNQGSGRAINQKLAELSKQPLTSNQRAEIAKLMTTYDNQFTILKDSLHSPKELRPNAAPNITPTDDSLMVAAIYTQAHDTIKKKPETENEPSEVEAAQAREQGALEVNVVAINETDFQIQDLKPNRDPKEKQALKDDLTKLLNQHQSKITFVVARGTPSLPSQTAWVPEP